MRHLRDNMSAFGNLPTLAASTSKNDELLELFRNMTPQECLKYLVEQFEVPTSTAEVMAASEEARLATAKNIIESGSPYDDPSRKDGGGGVGGVDGGVGGLQPSNMGGASGGAKVADNGAGRGGGGGGGQYTDPRTMSGSNQDRNGYEGPISTPSPYDLNNGNASTASGHPCSTCQAEMQFRTVGDKVLAFCPNGCTTGGANT